MQSTSEVSTATRSRKGRERMSNDKIDLSDFNDLLSLQCSPTAQAETTDPTPKPTPKEIAQQKTILKVYRKYQQREYERMRHPEQFPPDYFFSALAELILDD